MTTGSYGAGQLLLIPKSIQKSQAIGGILIRRHLPAPTAASIIEVISVDLKSTLFLQLLLVLLSLAIENLLARCPPSL